MNPSFNSDARCVMTGTCRGLSTITIGGRSGNSNRSSSGENGSGGYGSSDRGYGDRERSCNNRRSTTRSVTIKYNQNGPKISYPTTFAEFQNNKFWKWCKELSRVRFNEMVHRREIVLSEDATISTVQRSLNNGTVGEMKGIKATIDGKQAMFTKSANYNKDRYALIVCILGNDNLYHIDEELSEQLFGRSDEYKREREKMKQYERNKTYSRRNYPSNRR